jgi:hypothetical protein
MLFEIVWPEHRWVDDKKIDLWFSDAIANGEIPEEYASDPEFCGSDSIENKARELNSLGHITLGRGRR